MSSLQTFNAWVRSDEAAQPAAPLAIDAWTFVDFAGLLAIVWFALKGIQKCAM